MWKRNLQLKLYSGLNMNFLVPINNIPKIIFPVRGANLFENRLHSSNNFTIQLGRKVFCIYFRICLTYYMVSNLLASSLTNTKRSRVNDHSEEPP